MSSRFQPSISPCRIAGRVVVEDYAFCDCFRSRSRRDIKKGEQRVLTFIVPGPQKREQ